MTSLWYLPGLYVWVYRGCFWHYNRRDKCRLSWQAFDIDQGYTFEFIEAVSDTIIDMINAVYHDKPLTLNLLTLSYKKGPPPPKIFLIPYLFFPSPCRNILIASNSFSHFSSSKHKTNTAPSIFRRISALFLSFPSLSLKDAQVFLFSDVRTPHPCSTLDWLCSIMFLRFAWISSSDTIEPVKI